MQRTFTDQMNQKITLTHPPRRIVSLVPSQTELLHDLGLEAEVIGITKFCVRPESWFRNKTRVGGTKQIKQDIIKKLQPDLIIGNKEENDKQQIETLAAAFPVWMSDIQKLDDALRMIESVGKLVGKTAAARQLARHIDERFLQWQIERPASASRAAYFIWREPYMVAAAATFIDEMLQLAGFTNVFAKQQRYPEITSDELAAAKPEVILLSSEPYPFREKYFEEFKRLCPNAVIKIVDGELFSWYGSRLLHTPAYFRQLWQELNE